MFGTSRYPYILIASWENDACFRYPIDTPIPDGFRLVTKALDENGVLENKFWSTQRYSVFISGYAKHGMFFRDFDKPFYLPDSILERLSETRT